MDMNVLCECRFVTVLSLWIPGSTTHIHTCNSTQILIYSGQAHTEDKYSCHSSCFNSAPQNVCLSFKLLNDFRIQHTLHTLLLLVLFRFYNV